MHRSMSFRRRLAGAAALSLSHVLLADPAFAQSGGTPEISVPAAPLGEALKGFSEQTGIAVVFTEALVQGKMSAGTGGTADAGAALGALLRGTGLEAVPGGNGYVIRLRQGGSGNNPPPVRTAPARTPSGAEPLVAASSDGEQRLGQVTVTGTSLRGIAPESSPLQIYSREDILGSGVTTTEQFIRTLPQNFGGGSTEFLPGGTPSDPNSIQNQSFGTGANIRGLGAGATLTLLNGNRIAPASQIGDFVDLSLIPLSAVERVDVLTDGASSIYGADAVGGVMNFVLRRDFEGVELSGRYGTVTSGEMSEARYAQTFGTAWETGNLLASYEFLKRDNLTLSDRPGISAPTYLDGRPAPASFEYDLLPAQERHSILLAAHQSVTPALQLSGSALFSRREAEGRNYALTTGDNWVVNRPVSEVLTVSSAADYALSGDWAFRADGSFSQVRTHRSVTALAPTVRSLGVQVSHSDMWSVGGQFEGRVLALPGGDVRAALGGQLRQEGFTNRNVTTGEVSRDGDRDVAALYGEMQLPLIGADNALPGIQRLELNVSARLEDYSDFGWTSNPKVGLLWAPAETLRFRGTYSTSFAPPPLGRSGALDQTVAIMPYTFNRNLLGIPLPDPSLADVNFMVVNGTAPGLDAETSEAFTLGADYSKTFGQHSIEARLTYYDISFEGRLGATPIPGNLPESWAPSLAWEDPASLPAGTVVFFPTEAEIQAALQDYGRIVFLAGGATGPENIGFINFAPVTRNLASTETRGLDVQLDWEQSTDWGRLSAGINSSYILDFIQQASPSAPPVDILNTLYNPVDFKIRGRAGFDADGWSANAFVNHLASYQTDSTALSRGIGSWTTVDVTLAKQFSGAGLADGLRLSVSAVNVLDQDPPSTPSLGRFRLTGYDPANATPLGRFVTFEISKAF